MMTVLEDFARQAQVPEGMGIDRPDIIAATKDRRITINLQQVNFWVALSAICDGMGLTPASDGGTGQMILVAQNAAEMRRGFNLNFDLTNPHAVVSGPFLIEPTMCSENKMLTYSANGGLNSNMTLILGVACEPKLNVLGQTRQSWLIRCVDDHGNSLATAGGQAQRVEQVAWWWQLGETLADMPGRGSKLAELTGELQLSIQSAHQSIDVPDLENVHDKMFLIGQQTYIIHSFTRIGDRFQLQVSTPGMPGMVMRRAGGRFRMMGEEGNSLGLTVSDTNKHVMQQAGMSQIPSDARTVTTLNLLPQADLARTPDDVNVKIQGPYSLHWEITTETRTLPVRFTFRNLPLTP